MTLNLYGHLPVEIISDTDVRDHICDYFWPHCLAEQPDQSPAFSITLLRSSIQHALIARSEREPLTLYDAPDGYVDDYNMGYLWQLSPDKRVVCNPNTDTFFVVEGTSIKVLNANPELGIKDLCRVLKQLAATRFEALGEYVLHASAVVMGRRAIAFVGNKGAGKTTLMRAALSMGGRFISNDRIFVTGSSDRWLMRGWSDPIRILADPGSEKKISISLRSYFADARIRVVQGQASLSTVIFPRVTGAGYQPHAEPVDASAGLAMLTEQILPPRSRWLGVEADARLSAIAPPRCTLTALKTPYTAVGEALNVVLAMLDDAADPM